MLSRRKAGLWRPQFASSAVAFSLTYQSKATVVSASPANFGTLAIGAADPNRAVVVLIWSRGGTSVSGVTIGGIAASLVTNTNAANGATTLSEIWQADVPTGTTANVTVTYSGVSQQGGVYVYRLISATRTATAGQRNQTTAAVTTLANTITVPSGGVGINVAGQRNNIGIPTWTNATQNDSQVANAAHGTSASTTNGTGSVTVTMTGTASGEFCLSSAAWGP